MLEPATALQRLAADPDDGPAWEALAGDLGPWLRTVAQRCCPDPIAAEDAVQEALILARRDAWQFRPRSAPNADASAWLVRIVTNCARLQVRAAVRREAKHRRASVAVAMPPAQPDPLVVAETTSLVRSAVAALPRDTAGAVSLRYFAELEYPDIAAALGISEATARKRVQRGLASLRRRLGRVGATMSLIALVRSLRASPSPDAPPCLPHPLLFRPEILTMPYMMTLGGAAAGLALTLGIHLMPPQAPTAETPPPVIERQVRNVTVTPRTYNARNVFRDIAMRGGPRVGMLDVRDDPDHPDPSFPQLIIPAALRRKPIDAHSLIEAVAQRHGLDVAWMHNNHVAILSAPVSDAIVAQVKQDLLSSDPERRRTAAWHAGWLPDIRIVPLLLSSADDSDSAVARLAMTGMDRIGLGAVALILSGSQGFDPRNADQRRMFATLSRDGFRHTTLLERVLDNPSAFLRLFAIGELWRYEEAIAIPLLQRAIDDPSVMVRNMAINALSALGSGDSGRAIDLLEQILITPPEIYDFPDPRKTAILALGQIGSERALQVLGRFLTDPQTIDLAKYIVPTLATMDNPAALALLQEQIIDRTEGLATSGSPDDPVLDTFQSLRLMALGALAGAGDEQAFLEMEKALLDPNQGRIPSAVFSTSTLNRIDGERLYALLEAILNSHPNENLRAVAMRTLGDLGGTRALTLLASLNQNQATFLRDRDITNIAKAAYHADADPTRTLALVTQSLPSLSHPWVNTSHRSYRIVADMGGIAGLSFLADQLNHSEAAARLWAIRTLGAINPADRDAAAKLLLRTDLDSLPAAERLETTIALTRLGKISTPIALTDLLLPMILSPDPESTWNGLQQAHGFGLYPWMNEACEPLLNNPDESIRMIAYSLLTESSTPKLLPLLARGLQDSHIIVRSLAAHTMVRFDTPSARNVLLAWLPSEQDASLLSDMQYRLREYFGADPAVNEALEALETRLREARSRPAERPAGHNQPPQEQDVDF